VQKTTLATTSEKAVQVRMNKMPSHMSNMPLLVSNVLADYLTSKSPGQTCGIWLQHRRLSMMR